MNSPSSSLDGARVTRKSVKHFFRIGLLVFLLGIAFSHANPWVRLGKQDLYAIKQALETNSAPAACDTSFCTWLEDSYTEILQRVEKVQSEQEYQEVLLAYVNGFQDDHITLRPMFPKSKKSFTRTPHSALSLSLPSQKIGMQVMEEGVWIWLPTFNPSSSEEKTAFTDLLKQLSQVRSKKWIVFDVRGNRGGSTVWQRPLLRNLYGDSYLRSLGKRFDYNHLWRKKLRVSVDNLAYIKSQNWGCAAQFEKALKAKRAFFSMTWSVYNETYNLFSNGEKEPVTASVLLLTDEGCGSTCWLFVREMLQIPGVVQLGTPTAILTAYSETRPITLPSRHFILNCPMQVRLYPNENLGKPFVPTHVYSGDLTNEKQVQAWVMGKIEQ